MDLRIKSGTAVAECSSAVPVWGPMSSEARLAWKACAEPLSLVPVTFEVSAEDFQELVAVLEIVAEGPEVLRARSEFGSFFLTSPEFSPSDLAHGPARVHHRDNHSGWLINGLFFVVCALVALVLAGIVALAKLAYRRYPKSTRQVMAVGGLGATALVAITSSAAGPPLIVGGAWYWNKTSKAKVASADQQEVEAQEKSSP